MITFFSSFKIFLLINHGTTFSVLVTIGFYLNIMFYCDIIGNVNSDPFFICKFSIVG